MVWNDAMRELYERCESPAEESFFKALEGFALEEAIYMDPSMPWLGMFFVKVIPQHEIVFRDEGSEARYRLDFLFGLVLRGGNRTEPPDADLRMFVPTAVEIDGHEFHDRTPEQARRDRLRDRRLLQLGIPTIRFTAREVFKGAGDCIVQIDKSIEERMFPVDLILPGEMVRACRIDQNGVPID